MYPSMSLPPARACTVQSRRNLLSHPMMVVVVVADGLSPEPIAPVQPAVNVVTSRSRSAARDLGLILMVSSGAAAPVGARRQDAVGDQVAHHLERPAADREHARVAHHALERKTPSVAGGAVELQRLARDLLRGLRGERLRLR